MHNKVLIVEDDIDIVELLRLYLESSNYITSAASDGLMALDILKKEKITALIVTHDISEAISMSDRILVLSNRPGTIKDVHKIDFGTKNKTPLETRENPKFSTYFNILWKELREG